MDTRTELEAAIEGLYGVFGRYPKPVTMEACPHCVTLEMITRLLAKPLRTLSVTDLKDYAFKAVST